MLLGVLGDTSPRHLKDVFGDTSPKQLKDASGDTSLKYQRDILVTCPHKHIKDVFVIHSNKYRASKPRYPASVCCQGPSVVLPSQIYKKTHTPKRVAAIVDIMHETYFLS